MSRSINILMVLSLILPNISLYCAARITNNQSSSSKDTISEISSQIIASDMKKKNMTDLAIAIYTSDYFKLRNILEKGLISINHEYYWGKLLTDADYNPSILQDMCVKEGSYRSYYKSNYKSTPLIFATIMGENGNIVRLLIAHGADLNRADNIRGTALMHSLYIEEGLEPITRKEYIFTELLKAGADLDLPGSNSEIDIVRKFGANRYKILKSEKKERELQQVNRNNEISKNLIKYNIKSSDIIKLISSYLPNNELLEVLQNRYIEQIKKEDKNSSQISKRIANLSPMKFNLILAIVLIGLAYYIYW